MANIEFPKTANGKAVLISDTEYRYTNPDLHRRVENNYPTNAFDGSDFELFARKYDLGVYNKNSIRTTSIFTLLDMIDLYDFVLSSFDEETKEVSYEWVLNEDQFKAVFGRDLPTDEKEQIDALLRENIAKMEITEIP